MTFDPHPDEIVRPGSHPPFLSTTRRRAELLGGLGTDAVCLLPFTYEFSQLGPDEFVRTVLADRLHAAAVVVGEDFRFGHKAAGDVPLLATLGEKYDFSTEGVPLLAADGVTISSTFIRERLEAGEVATAAAVLGRPHRVEGIVYRGHMRGRAAGLPHREPGEPAALGHTGGRHLRRLAAPPGRGRRRRRPLARRDLGRAQRHLRRGRAHGRGLRPGPRRPGPVRRARGHRLLRPPPRHRTLRLGRGPDHPDAPRRRPGPATAGPVIT